MAFDQAQAAAQQDALRDVFTLVDWRRRVFEEIDTILLK